MANLVYNFFYGSFVSGGYFATEENAEKREIREKIKKGRSEKNEYPIRQYCRTSLCSASYRVVFSVVFIIAGLSVVIASMFQSIRHLIIWGAFTVHTHILMPAWWRVAIIAGDVKR